MAVLCPPWWLLHLHIFSVWIWTAHQRMSPRQAARWSLFLDCTVSYASTSFAQAHVCTSKWKHCQSIFWQKDGILISPHSDSILISFCTILHLLKWELLLNWFACYKPNCSVKIQAAMCKFSSKNTTPQHYSTNLSSWAFLFNIKMLL